MNKITISQMSEAFSVPTGTIRQAAYRNKIGKKSNDRLLFTAEETFKLLCLLRVPPKAITEKETRSIIRQVVFDYCKTKR